MNKKIIGIGVVVLVLILLVISVNKPSDNKSIKIGFIGPLSGDLAVYGEIEKNVIQIAVDEINKTGGIDGKPIEVIYEDDQCAGKNALSSVQKLIDIDKVKIFLVTCSQSVLPISPVTEKNKALVFASYAASSAISDAGDYVFRNAYSNADISRVAANVIVEKFQKIAVISEITDYATDLKDNFKREYIKAGGSILIEEDYPTGTKDFRSSVSKIISLKPAAIFVNPTSDATGIPILNQLRDLGYSGQLYGNFVGSSKTVQSLSSAEGMIYFADPVVEENPKKAELLEKYKAKYNEYPDYEYPTVARYDSVYILAQALKSVGDNPTKIKDYLYSMPEFSGALGTYRFDSKGDITNVKPIVNQILGGKAVKYELK